MPELSAVAAPAPVAAPAAAPAASSAQNDLDAKKLELIEQIKKSSSLDQLKNVMAVNALEGSPLPIEKEAAPVVPAPAPVVPKPIPAKKTASQTLADLEAQIQETDQQIKETKTVSVDEILGPDDKLTKKDDKQDHLQKPKLTQKPIKSSNKKDANSTKGKN